MHAGSSIVAHRARLGSHVPGPLGGSSAAAADHGGSTIQNDWEVGMQDQRHPESFAAYASSVEDKKRLSKL